MTLPAFTQEHFNLLASYAQQPWTKSPAEQQAKKSLGFAYEATKVWAERLMAKRFPGGRTVGAKHVLMRGNQFSPYTWWRIYPHTTSPDSLAYTVGIDKSGHFIVKIDTYGYDRADPVRVRYEVECGGGDLRGAPFWSVLDAQNGLAMSIDELVDWSIVQIDAFRPTYDELWKELTDIPVLEMVAHPDEADRLFQGWLACLTQNGTKVRDGFQFDNGGFVFNSAPDGRQTKLKLAKGKEWLVEVNQAATSLSTIAKDKSGNSYLLRRGRLQKNQDTGKGISEDHFARNSGLRSVSLLGGTSDKNTGWYVVAALSESPDVLIETTAQFVRACARARGINLGVPEALPAESYFISRTEKGGSYLIRPQAARQAQRILRLHGEVWLALSKHLAPRGIKLAKCQHPLGYEIDGFFLTSDDRKILVEIKTSSSASSVHAAVGQLHLYPALMPELSGSEKYLLLPSLPDPEVVKAIKKLDINLVIYDSADPSDIKISVESFGTLLQAAE